MTATAKRGDMIVHRIGESGSRAVWTGSFSQQQLPRTGPTGPPGE